MLRPGVNVMHIHIERAALDVGQITPARIDQILPRGNESASARQGIEQVELLSIEMN